MAEADPQAAWERRAAMDGNNRAWALSIASRSPAEDREMLDAAHASAWHWARIGTELHRMRATMLLAEVHALLGHGATALDYAAEMHRYFTARTETPDWERAFAITILAHAAHAAGDLARHASLHPEAAAALAAIADDEDRAIVAETLRQVPVPAP